MFDEDFEHSVLREVAGHDEQLAANYDVAQAWQHIVDDLRSRGPFTRMLLEMRASASSALQELVYAEPARVSSLQSEVRRYAHMMTILSEYRTRAEAAGETTDDSELSDKEDQFVANLER